MAKRNANTYRTGLILSRQIRQNWAGCGHSLEEKLSSGEVAGPGRCLLSASDVGYTPQLPAPAQRQQHKSLHVPGVGTRRANQAVQGCGCYKLWDNGMPRAGKGLGTHPCLEKTTLTGSRHGAKLTGTTGHLESQHTGWI